MTDETTPAEDNPPAAASDEDPPADDAPAEDPPASDPAAPQDVEFADSETEPLAEGEPAADEVEPLGAVGAVGVTQIPEQEQGRGEVIAGEVEPNVLSSGDELPRHRQEVEGIG